MRTSLIISTYNRPDALKLVLLSILQQTQLPHEIIVADDGSGEETRSVVNDFRGQSPVPVIHVWQEDLGFRLARVRNLGVSKSRGDYLIFIDGDVILHPAFLASHLSASKEGLYLQGRRAMLSYRMTTRILQNGRISISPFALGISLRKHAFHIPVLSRIFSHTSPDWYHTLGANKSLWRKDFIAINGFNEDFEGWGREDSEFSLRLMRSGLQKFELRFCAIVFHLAHGKDNKVKYAEATERNQQLLDDCAASGMVWCENGFDHHL